jgi:hypothetical protein
LLYRALAVAWAAVFAPLAAAGDSPYFAPPGTAIAVSTMEDVYDDRGPLRRWIASHDARQAEQEQDDDGFIQTDRPSFTNAQTTVPDGWVQLESGYQYTYNATDVRQSNTHNLPQLNLRVGLTDRTELRILWGGVSWVDDEGLIDTDHERSSNMQVGFKFVITRENGWVPQSALVATVFVPTGDGNGQRPTNKTDNFSRRVVPLVDYIYAWTLDEEWTLVGSTGGLFDDPEALVRAQAFQSIVIQRDWSKRVSAFYEAYCIWDYERSGTKGSPYMDGGVLWRPLNDVLFDWRAGFGLNNNSDDFYTGVGFSFRY